MKLLFIKEKERKKKRFACSSVYFEMKMNTEPIISNSIL